MCWTAEETFFRFR